VEIIGRDARTVTVGNAGEVVCLRCFGAVGNAGRRCCAHAVPASRPVCVVADLWLVR
jgi:hypothetical protein